jgi:hypothetical protein
LAPSAVAQQCALDAFEPNDLCAQAAPLSAGVHGGLTSAADEFDWFRIDVPAGQRLEVRLNATSPSEHFGLLALPRDDGGAAPCGFETRVQNACFGGAQSSAIAAWSASDSAPTRFYLSVLTAVSPCTSYELDVRVVPEPCAALPADALEGNDSCAAAPLVGLGSHPALSVSISDPDYYRVLVQPGELITVLVSGLPLGAFANLWAWDAGSGCGAMSNLWTGSALFGGSVGGVQLANLGATPREFVFQVEPVPDSAASSGFCVDYQLDVLSDLDPCGLSSPDAFEPNNSCAAAAPLSSSHAQLSIALGDPDWYLVDVPPRSSVRVLSRSTTTNQSLSMMLHQGCSGASGEFLASSWNVYADSADPRHFMSWSNPTASSVSARFHVHFLGGAPGAFCDTYDLELGFTLGVPFCHARRNSTGEGARLTASGSTQPGVGHLTFSASPLPPNKAGLLIMSRSATALAPLGHGYLCLSGSISRFPLTTTGAGALLQTLDWTGPAAQIASGDTWNFQAWHRDPAAQGGGVNLSEGLRISFE